MNTEPKHIVQVNGFCCDRGNFSREYTFSTEEAAKEYIAQFNEDEESGNFYSDGPSSAHYVGIKSN